MSRDVRKRLQCGAGIDVDLNGTSPVPICVGADSRGRKGTLHAGTSGVSERLLRLLVMPRSSLLAGALLLLAVGCSTRPSESPPNIILVMTDDMGYGDLGFHGNPILETPNLDAMAERSARLESFYVSPVCAPTRASLMTGRYNQRTRAIDTYIGRAMMEPDEVTIAEMLRNAGYATGIFGKWHLGDSSPMRAMDQGFDEPALVHRGGGIGQPSDDRLPEEVSKYTNATLWRNGVREETEGYCTDVYFDNAMDFLARQQSEGRPFFAYIPTNAPHGPYHDVPEELYQKYKARDIRSIQVDENPSDQLLDNVARVFAMIENVDENMGRLFAHLDQLGLTENTVVIFMVDNGPNSLRYVRQLRGMKSHVHDGGIRSPFFVQWPNGLTPGSISDRIAAHIDVTPTLLEIAGATPPDSVRLDGRSLLPLLQGSEEDWTDRSLVIQTHRGDVSVRYHHAAIMTQDWKLVNPSGFGRDEPEGEPEWELYERSRDPGETINLVNDRPEVVAEMVGAYDVWFDDVSTTRPDNFAPPHIVVGTEHEPVTTLTRQDWRHTHGRPWAPESNGYWLLDVAEAGSYQVAVTLYQLDAQAEVTLTVGDQALTQSASVDDRVIRFEDVELSAGPMKLETRVGPDGRGAWQVVLSSDRLGLDPSRP